MNFIHNFKRFFFHFRQFLLCFFCFLLHLHTRSIFTKLKLISLKVTLSLAQKDIIQIYLSKRLKLKEKHEIYWEEENFHGREKREKIHGQTSSTCHTKIYTRCTELKMFLSVNYILLWSTDENNLNMNFFCFKNLILFEFISTS